MKRGCYGQPQGYYSVGKGKARVVHPVYGPSGPTPGEIRAKARKAGRKPKRQRTIKPRTPTSASLKPSRKKGESFLNLKITGQIQRKYPGQSSEILQQAQGAYHYRNPHVQQNAEPYELAEGGYINEALETMGLKPLPGALGSYHKIPKTAITGPGSYEKLTNYADASRPKQISEFFVHGQIPVKEETKAVQLLGKEKISAITEIFDPHKIEVGFGVKGSLQSAERNPEAAERKIEKRLDQLNLLGLHVKQPVKIGLPTLDTI